MNKKNNIKNCHICLRLDYIPKYKPIRPTYEEIERTLPGFKDQHVPKMMTLEILEEAIPFVKEFRSKMNNSE